MIRLPGILGMGGHMTELVDQVTAALRASKLECTGRNTDSLRELAHAAIEAMRAHEPRRPQPSPDKLNEAFERATRL
jgi:hypothetical protein